MYSWQFSHSFTLCHAQCTVLSDMLSQQLYFFFFEKEILELLTKSLHKYKVIITLLRTLRDPIFCLHVLLEWHSQWNLFKSASSAPGIEDVKNHSEDVKSLEMIIINYLHQVSHFLNTFLKKFFPKHITVALHKIQYFRADRKLWTHQIKHFYSEIFKY